MMTRKKVAHLLRAAAAITNENRFVLIGSAAVLATKPPTPAAMLRTNEIDIYSPRGPEDDEDVSDLIQGTLGPDSRFYKTYGYAADGVSSTTAALPKGWEKRAKAHEFEGAEGIVAIVPEIHDIAASKLVAWREKDIEWLEAGLTASKIGIETLKERVELVEPERMTADVGRNRIKMLTSFLERSASQPASPIASKKVPEVRDT